MHSFFKQYTTGFLAAEPKRKRKTADEHILGKIEHILREIEDAITSLVRELNDIQWFDDPAVLEKVNELQEYIQTAISNPDVGIKRNMIHKIHEKVAGIVSELLYNTRAQQIIEDITKKTYGFGPEEETTKSEEKQNSEQKGTWRQAQLHMNGMNRFKGMYQQKIIPKTSASERNEQIRIMNCEIARLNRILTEKNEMISRLKHFAREYRPLQLRVKEAQRNETEAKHKLVNVQRCTQDDDVSPLFTEDDTHVTEVFFKEQMRIFTKAMSKKRKKSITAKDFVVIVYAPYYDEAFGNCYVPRIDEILDECHLDEVTEKVTCSLKASEIKKYFVQFATEKHFAEIYKRFDKFKQSSYVLQRLWDMGYHQAKDVVRGLEKLMNVPFLDKRDGDWKGIVFGVEPGICFVSGDDCTGVGDHIQPVRANRHVTGCYGGNSKWNLAPVISALNKPYKNMVLYQKASGQFHKICLDNATFENVSFAGFYFQDRQSFDAQYALKRGKLESESQRFNCLVRLRNFYKNNDNVHRLDNAILVRNSVHFYRLIQQAFNVDISLLKSIAALPSCSQRTQIPKFLTELQEQKVIMDILKSKTMNVKRLFQDSSGIKKAYRALWTELGLMNIVDFLKSSNAVKLLRWMETKEKKGLYQKVNALDKKVDALDIYMRLNLWQAYVLSIGNDVRRGNDVPKMEWEMSAEDFDKIEDILKKGVKIIHDGTKAFIDENAKAFIDENANDGTKAVIDENANDGTKAFIDENAKAIKMY